MNAFLFYRVIVLRASLLSNLQETVTQVRRDIVRTVHMSHLVFDGVKQQV